MDRNDPLVQRCFGRMAAWVGLVVTTLDAEFPAFETLASAAVFSLKSPPSQLEIARHLEKIAATFKLDKDRLALQFSDFKVTAGRCREKLGDKETGLLDLKVA